MRFKIGSDAIGRRILRTIDQLMPRLGMEMEALLEAPLGCEVVIEPIHPKQTDSQRGYYWKSLHLWGDDAGYSAKESETWLHNAVCCEAWGVKATWQIGGSMIEIPMMTSAKLTREDYSKLIDTMLRLAAEAEVYIPPPEKVA